MLNNSLFLFADLLLARGPNCQGMVCRHGTWGHGKLGGVRGMAQGGGVRGVIGVECIFCFQQNNLNVSILNFKDKSTVYSNNLCK